MQRTPRKIERVIQARFEIRVAFRQFAGRYFLGNLRDKQSLATFPACGSDGINYGIQRHRLGGTPRLDHLGRRAELDRHHRLFRPLMSGSRDKADVENVSAERPLLTQTV